MTSPFKSIKDTVQNQPNMTPRAANDDQSQPSIDDLIAGLFAKRKENSSNSSANFDGHFPADQSP